MDGTPLSREIVAKYRKVNGQKLLSNFGVSSLRSGENWFILTNSWSAWRTALEPRIIPGVPDNPDDIWSQKMKQYEEPMLQYVLPGAALDDLRLLLYEKLDRDQIIALKDKLISPFGRAVADELSKPAR